MVSRSLSALIALTLAPLLSLSAQAEPLSPAQVDAAFKAQFGDPGPRCDDATFLRRLSLDVEGRLPSAEGRQRFLKSPDKNRRAKAIDAALRSPHSHRFLGRRLARRLIESSTDARLAAALGRWCEDALKANRPYNAMVADLVAAEGPIAKNFAGVFLLQYRGQAADAATAVARQFLAVSLDCARCHDHPFNDWKQSQFHELAASFGRLRVRRQQQRFELYESPIGDYRYKLHGQDSALTFAPRMLDGTDLSKSHKRRRALVQWMTKADPKGLPSVLARAEANRVFEELFGITLVGTSTDMPSPETDPKLLTMLARHLQDAQFDLRSLRRLLLSTRAYQRARELALRKDQLQPKLIRPLDADQLSGALLVVTGRDKPAKGELPFLHRAMQRSLYNELAALQATGPEGGIFGSSVRQALRLLHGKALNSLTRAAKDRVLGQLLKGVKEPHKRLEALCHQTLQRAPSKAEQTRWLRYLKDGQDAPERYEDIFWALITCAEFACQR